MQSQLTWLDHDPKARERAIRILHLLRTRESRDELGLGSIRDSFSDKLFPGTSTIQTRLRYMLFIPWIYKKLENEGVSGTRFAEKADTLERTLNQELARCGDTGGFGKNSGKDLQRLASSVYWAGLGTWGIRSMSFSRDDYHRNIGELYKKQRSHHFRREESKSRQDDYDWDIENGIQSWHYRLPDPPDDFPYNVDFNLTKMEAEFIQERIRVEHPESLLALLATKCRSTYGAKNPWSHRGHADFSPEHKELLRYARLFSETMHGASLLYNWLLADLTANKKLMEHYFNKINEWSHSLPLAEIKTWTLNNFWSLIGDQRHHITPKTKEFVTEWVGLTRSAPHGIIKSQFARDLVRKREMKLKSGKSRFENTEARKNWSGKSNLNPLNYRWPQVRILLDDLYRGLYGK